MRKLQKTQIMKRYLFKFVLRFLVFAAVLTVYLVDRDGLYRMATQPIRLGITPLHILWAAFMVIMLMHIFPTKARSMALRKAEKYTYCENEGYSELELHRFVQQQNVRAWTVMLIWLSFNAIFGILYLADVITEVELLLLTVFYFLCDYICILIYCPFQSLIMKNRCCINCRIYDWGHFMMFTPMLFIRNFYSWSLFFTSIVVLIRWEISYATHPERFWSGSNKTLQCQNCKDRTCQIKRALQRKSVREAADRLREAEAAAQNQK